MASSGSSRGGLLSAGGVLSIVAGISQIISAVSLVVNAEFPSSRSFMLAEMLFLPFLPDNWLPTIVSGLAVFIGLWCAGVLGILAVGGGISAIKRKSFGLSLAGAICALPSVILGILAVIFVALGKREFGAKV